MTTGAICLDWEPLLRNGRYPEGADDVEKLGLNGPGIYLFIMRYPRTSVVYVGRASNLGYRIREHMANYLGFRYALRKDDPNPGRQGDNIYEFSRPQFDGFNQFNNLEAAIQKSAKEVGRMRFYFCRCDAESLSKHQGSEVCLPDLPTAELTKELEATLIRYVRQMEADDLKAKRPIPVTSDNFRCESRKHSVELDQDDFKSWLLTEIANAPLPL